MRAIELSDVGRAYGERIALQGVTLDLEAGETLAEAVVRELAAADVAHERDVIVDVLDDVEHQDRVERPCGERAQPPYGVAGGIEVEKMKPEPQERTKSTVAAVEAT